MPSTATSAPAGNSRVLVTGTIHAFAQGPLQILGANRLQHVVPQRDSGAVVRLAGKVKAIGGEVGAVGAAVGKQWDVGVDHEWLVHNRPVIACSVPGTGVSKTRHMERRMRGVPCATQQEFGTECVHFE